jgi:hypothetical protein
LVSNGASKWSEEEQNDPDPRPHRSIFAVIVHIAGTDYFDTISDQNTARLTSIADSLRSDSQSPRSPSELFGEFRRDARHDTDLKNDHCSHDDVFAACNWIAGKTDICTRPNGLRNVRMKPKKRCLFTCPSEKGSRCYVRLCKSGRRDRDANADEPETPIF